MTENTRRVLELMSDGKLTVDEAERMLHALAGEGEAGKSQQITPKYFVMSASDDTEASNFKLKVPLSVIRAGIKLGMLVPDESREPVVEGLKAKGIDINPFEMSEDQVEEFIAALSEFEMSAGDENGHFLMHLE